MKKYVLSAVAMAAALGFAGAAYADILIGVAGPLTGPNAAFGAQLQKGAEQAAADINAAGGINGEKIALTFGDDVSDPKQGISVANKFVADGVKYVIGHFNSGVTIPASEVYAENGVLVITPSATNPQSANDALAFYLSEKQAAKDLVEKFRAAGFEPEAYALYSYAALQVVAAAANQVGRSDDAKAVADAIKASGPWATAIGEIGYTAHEHDDGSIRYFRPNEEASPCCDSDPQCSLTCPKK